MIRRLFLASRAYSCSSVAVSGEVLLERAPRRDVELLQFAVVGPHGFRGADLAVGHAAQQGDERQRVLGVLDLAAEQRHPGAVLAWPRPAA